MIALYNDGRLTVGCPSARMTTQTKALWPPPSNATEAWQIIVEANALGATPIHIEDLMIRWQLTSEEAIVFAHTKFLELTCNSLDNWTVTGKLAANMEHLKVSGTSPLDVLTEAVKPIIEAFWPNAKS
jgi:hypothetical protein